MTKIAFIGFGEAGSLLAKGLSAAGAEISRCYDILIHDSAKAAALKERAAALGLAAQESPAGAIAGADVIISAVTTSNTLDAAMAAADCIEPGQIYLDINSVSPATKRQAAVAVERAGAHFVEAAVMDLVPPNGHTVPMLLAGPRAHDLEALLRPFAMNVRAIGTAIGNASSVKMVRSVYMKGFTAVFLECLVAAKALDAEDAVLDSLQTTFPQMDWRGLADYYLPRLVQHAGRQAGEMKSVAETLKELGIEPITAEASGKRLKWLGDMHLGESADDLPRGHKALLAAILRKARGE